MLLLDEPTASLDPQATRDFEQPQSLFTTPAPKSDVYTMLVNPSFG